MSEKTSRKAKARKKQGLPRHSENGSISYDGMQRVYFEMKAGDAHPQDVRAALRRIETELRSGRELSQYASRFLAKALSLFNQGTVATLDQAFGLKRTKEGTPSRDVGDQQRMAAMVLREHLAGHSLNRAFEIVSDHSDVEVGKSALRAIWEANRVDAYHVVSLERGDQTPKWTEEERRTLDAIFAPLNVAVRLCIEPLNSELMAVFSLFHVQSISSRRMPPKVC